MTDDIYAKLAAPFAPEEVSWRVGPTNADKTKGMALAYVDARVVMDRLDAVCTPAGWQNRYSHANGKTVCDIGIKDGEWIWKADGAGDSDMEAEKGALSDAFKRAAVRWGIGRYLYETQSPWVAIKPMGKSFVIEESEKPKLYAILAGKPMATVPVPHKASPPSKRDITPMEWVNASKSTIDTFRTPRELAEWEQKPSNKGTIERLHVVEPELAEDMEAFLGRARKKLKDVAA